MTLNVDWSVIDKYEISTSFGYAIPKDEKSGITVGSGFDLGQHSWSQIDALPISAELKSKLRPFVLMRGAAARNLLYVVPEAFRPDVPIERQIRPPRKMVISNEHRSAHVLASSGAVGLWLSPEEVLELNTAVRTSKLGEVVEKFNAAAVGAKGKPFATVPSSVQTAVVSFIWQYGENIDTKGADDRRKMYWAAAVANDWSEVIEIILGRFMCDRDKSFHERRMEEIQLLKRGLSQPYGPRMRNLFDRALRNANVA